MKYNKNMRKGITMIELLISLALLAILMTIGVTLMNPGGQLAGARNSQRELHLTSLMNGVRQNMADTSGGAFTCASGPIPTTTRRMASGAGNYDIAPCLVSSYLPVMPVDPSLSGARWTSVLDYDSGYDIVKSATSGQVTISSPGAELGRSITITR
jgi:prepilin-type N-terminal cleavage/methylation domain-containing protein